MQPPPQQMSEASEKVVKLSPPLESGDGAKPKQGKWVKKKKSEAARKVQDDTPVEIADHLSAWFAMYHITWSGEVGKFRGGVLSEGQAWFVCFFSVLFPSVQVLSMAAAFVSVRRIFSEGLENTLVVVVFFQMIRTLLLSLTSSPEGAGFIKYWEINEDVLTITTFLVDAAFACAWAYSWLSIGKNWDAYHGTKMATLMCLYASVHNPVFGTRQYFKNGQLF